MAYIDKTGVDNIFKETKKAVSPISITYNDLASLKGSGQLVPGKKYRITDYVTKVSESYTSNYHVKSAEHPFDLIVTAIDNTTLSDVAAAALHEGDSYFSSCNLGAWQVWYHFDSYSGNFEWTGDMGTIYRMIDEWGNDLPFDFKNIMFEMYHVDEILSSDSDIANTLNGTGNPSMEWWFADQFNTQAISITETDGSKQYYGMNTSFWNGGTVYGTGGSSTTADKHTGQYCAEFQGQSPYITFVTSSSKESAYVYAFSIIYNGTVTDTSVDNRGSMNNVVKSRHDDYGVSDSKTIRLPKIIMSISGACKDNVVGYNCNDIIIGSLCNSNNIGNNCHDIILSATCTGERILDECYSDYFYNCDYNTLGTGCYSNVFLTTSNNNILNNQCFSNIFKSSVSFNTLGNQCYSNVFAGSANNNILGDGCNNNSLGGVCNKLGSGCSYNTVGSTISGYNELSANCTYNKVSTNGGNNYIGTGSSSNDVGGQCNKLGILCSNNNINGHYNSLGNCCSSISFGSADGCSYNTFGSYCENITLNGNGHYNSFGNNCHNITLGNYSQNNLFDGNDTSIKLGRPSGSTYTDIVQNYHFKLGVTSYDHNTTATINSTSEITVPS